MNTGGSTITREELIAWLNHQAIFYLPRSETGTALREAAALLAADANRWKPIATAPKDRTILLGYDYEGHLFTASSGYWTETNGGGWVRQCLFQPTHWQPLPAPPPAAKE